MAGSQASTPGAAYKELVEARDGKEDLVQCSVLHWLLLLIKNVQTKTQAVIVFAPPSFFKGPPTLTEVIYQGFKGPVPPLPFVFLFFYF